MRIAVTFLFFFTLIVFSGSSQKKNRKKKKDQVEAAATSDLFQDEKRVKFEATLIEAEKQLILENNTKAIELLKKALEMNPTSGAANFKLAETLTKTSSLVEALPYSQAAIESDRTNKYYFLLTAEIHKAMGDFDAAAVLYDEMINNIEDTESYLFELAVIYQYRGNYDLALETYQKAEEVFGLNEKVLREKQKIYLSQNDNQSLIRDWDKLIAENLDNSRYTIELAEYLIGKNLLTEARERLLKVKEENIHIDLLLSQIALKEGNEEEALKITLDAFSSESLDYKTKIKLLNSYLDAAISPEQFEAVITMSESLGDSYPDKFEAQAYAGDVLYRMEKSDEALKYYLRAIRIEPSNYSVWQNILNIEAVSNSYDSLIAHADEALEYFPNQAPLYYFSGIGHMFLKKHKKSVQMLDQGTKYSTDPGLLTLFYGQMGDVYNSMKESAKSYASYEKALENNPTNDHVLNNYSYFLSLDKKDLDKALVMSTKLVELHPENPTYLDTHGWVLYSSEKYAEAEKFLGKAAKLDNDATVIEHYGDVLYKLGKVEEAVEQWEKASKLSDASENILKKIADKTLYE
ncbi:MAG: tetratricopeptide repeat protein [Cyclobacteriaceae bacterium]